MTQELGHALKLIKLVEGYPETGILHQFRYLGPLWRRRGTLCADSGAGEVNLPGRD